MRLTTKIKLFTAIISALGIMGTANAGNSSANTAISGNVGDGVCTINATGGTLNLFNGQSFPLKQIGTLTVNCPDGKAFGIVGMGATVSGLSATLTNNANTQLYVLGQKTHLPAGLTTVDNATYAPNEVYQYDWRPTHYCYAESLSSSVCDSWFPDNGLYTLYNGIGTGSNQVINLAVIVSDLDSAGLINATVRDSNQNWSLSATFRIDY